ncbi:hypothetical protein EDI_106800 [Entamoeba dispar SAW760]|uniref:TLDc domain-containing protein n=1 Tax=Entamoeba dispar (strain ATCC PRA-260 / SAW760) TaxID=370354 RepID=B0ET58_ENTDS|nr:uncharacterized protein EDI_106800 [Entamoeba dispar SAW760]EDR22311.1 hypothetical protein EDI_106800 [Entamoeba dispar SAW760]|eukprot:EDR22311.1 hypothetical protein EDI_106800 [Entamoeba dispar SAW760]
MDFVKPFIPQLQEWTGLNFKEILFDSNIHEMNAQTINSKIVYHRCICYIVQSGEYVFGSFIGETVPYAEEKMSNAIENDWKHFIFTLNNPQHQIIKIEPQYHEDFTSLFVYGTLNKRNVISTPNAFFINPGNNCYITKNIFDYYIQPEHLTNEIFVGCCQPKRFTADRLVVVEMIEKE